ncbi:ABC transporter permease [Saccharococcus thermophilus]|uniref:ABC-2 type transport system permease protein n=1 Tax=Saccharococcus thermophilus TaxID=29396 RepID=A0A846MDU9_9BACL|nr:ABC transporter permease [Saccharococcus thermophilus]NIK14677.1 ABC-2 type transport system permease protein [Saccharococcus thermophilus]
MKSIIIKELKLLVKEKGNFFFLIVLPILFTVVFGSIFDDTNDVSLTIQYVDQDHSSASKDFLHHLDQIPGIQVKEVQTSVHKQVQQIKNGKLASLLVIPKGFHNLQTGDPVNVLFYHDAANSASSAPIQAILNSVANQYREYKLSSTLASMGKTKAEITHILQPPIQIKEMKENAVHIRAIEQIVPGYTVMFVFFIILVMLRSFLREKESGMISRLRSTPMNPLEYLIGMWIPAIISVLIQCTILLTFGHFVYDLHLGDLGAISLIILCLSICGTGLGLAVSFLVKGENQGRGITMLITLGGAALGGLWVPYDMLPSALQTIAHYTPQFWAQKGMQDVIIRGAHLNDIWPTLMVLLVFGIVGLLIGLLRFKSFLRSAAN